MNKVNISQNKRETKENIINITAQHANKIYFKSIYAKQIYKEEEEEILKQTNKTITIDFLNFSFSNLNYVQIYDNNNKILLNYRHLKLLFFFF